MKTTLEIFSNNLRNQLAAQRKTQADLSKFLGVTETSVSRWVNGFAMPRPKMIDSICIFLNCTADQLTADHEKVAVLAPEDVMAEEMKERPLLFQLMFYASRLDDAELEKLIERVK